MHTNVLTNCFLVMPYGDKDMGKIDLGNNLFPEGT